MTRVVLHALHVVSWGLAYGALTYTYFRLTAQMRAFTGSEDEYETGARITGRGLDRWLAGALVVAAVTGLALAGLDDARSAPSTAAWRTVIAIKVVIAAIMAAVQVVIARRMWPRRLGSQRESWPVRRRAFFRVAFFLGFLLLCQLVLGATAHLIAHAD